MVKDELNIRKDDKQSDNPFSPSVPTNYDQRSNKGNNDSQRKESDNKEH